MAKRRAFKDDRGAAQWADGNLIAAKLDLRNLFDGARSESEWPNWAEEIRTVRLELRKLLDRYPQAFTAIMKLIANGEDLDALLPPRSLERVSEETLAQLLADYRNARDLGWTRLDYFTKAAEHRWPWGGVSCLYGGYHAGIWNTADAIEAQLKKAERLVKKDEAFAQAVDFWQDCMTDKYLGAILWGRKNA